MKLNPLKKGTFDSASGLKPMSAYVVVGAVLAMSSGRLFQLSQAEVHASAFVKTNVEHRAPEDYRIVDREGRVLAASVPSYDLLLSPQVMWQNHTPLRIAKSIAESMGQNDAWAEALMHAMLPAGHDGWRRVDEWPLSQAEAARLGDWVTENEMRGFSVEQDKSDSNLSWLWWRPSEVLSETERLRHFERVGPSNWTRHLARGLWTALHGNARENNERVRYDAKAAGEEVWGALLPEVHNVPIERILPTAAMAVQAALAKEKVSRDHMRLELRADRDHPAGEFPTLGQWGYITTGQKKPEAYVGLELRARELSDAFAATWTDSTQSEYKWTANRVSRRGATPYFQGASDAAPPIVVESTIDLALQRRMHDELTSAMQRHDATLAMGIILDVQSGEVLALDSVSAFPTNAFLPVAHLFTPGSTFKLVTMAMGLDAGVVDPNSNVMGVGRFDVGHGQDWPIPREFGLRTIDEAQGAPTGIQSLAACLAHSINAGMVQVGVKLSPAHFRGKLIELGYGKRPNAGLGGENFWPLKPLSGWKVRNEQVSISFGHNISVSLFQHAENLSAILRDGLWRPLVMVRAVSQADRRMLVDSERTAPHRVFKPGVGLTVRDMMTLGAREGTGEKIVRDDIEMGTKTGTTWKEEGVLSTRVEMRALAQHIANNDQLTIEQWKAERKALAQAHAGDKREYTSSVIAVGHLPDTDASREIMVLVVIDEPHEGKFGSAVAGPTAVALLAEALGLSAYGEEKQLVQPGGFMQLSSDPDAERLTPGSGLSRDLPWMKFVEGEQ